MAKKMRLQLLCLLAFISCGPGYSVPQPSALKYYIQVQAGQSRNLDFLEWLASIFAPTTTVSPSTTAAVTTNVTYSTTRTTTVQPAAPPTERECSACRCGLANTLRKVVGGQQTQIHQYPWIAVVLLQARFYCAGSLFSDLYVLTAAHCILYVPAELITVRLLEHNRSQSHDWVLELRAQHTKIHELYNPRTFDNDIALIRLEQPVQLSGALRPICLPVPWFSFDGEWAIATGWGAQQEGGLATDTLQEVSVQVLSQAECRSTSYGAGQITDNMLCAGDLLEGGKDACTGDSGGPLQAPFNDMPDQYQLAGIVSWGDGCARPNAPGVYTRVNRYLCWIATHTPDACYCQPYAEQDY